MNSKNTNPTITSVDSTKSGGVRGATKYKANPFMENIFINTRSKKLTVSRGSKIVDMSTGEVEGITEIAQVVLVDDGQFIKLFTKDLAIWFELSRPAMRVFGALLSVIQKEAVRRDLVFFDRQAEEVKSFKLQKTSFFKGIEELLSKGFIARHVSAGWYFINPNMFFNGDRARFIKEYRKKWNQNPVDTLTGDLFEETNEANITNDPYIE